MWVHVHMHLTGEKYNEKQVFLPVIIFQVTTCTSNDDFQLTESIHSFIALCCLLSPGDHVRHSCTLSPQEESLQSPVCGLFLASVESRLYNSEGPS